VQPPDRFGVFIHVCKENTGTILRHKMRSTGSIGKKRTQTVDFDADSFGQAFPDDACQAPGRIRAAHQDFPFGFF
jgi:hypothetical protein